MTGQRIRQARLAAGLTQDEVVKRLAGSGQPITKAALSKYELGKSTPSAAFLLKLAEALGVKAAYFLREPDARVEWLGFRKHSQLTAPRQERIKARVADVASGQFELQSVLYPDEQPIFIAPRVASSTDDAEAAAAALRDAWRLGEDPIESVTEVVEDHGGIVVAWSEDTGRFDGLSGWINGRFPLAVINMGVPRDRCRYNLAHELGHMAMRCEGMDEKDEERLAHRFAAAFLVPAEVAYRELGRKRRRLDLAELGLLKRKHGLSIQAWIRRAYDLGIIEKGTYSRLYVRLAARGQRTNEPYALEGTEEPTRLRQMTLRALAEGVITEEKALELCPDCVTPEPQAQPEGRQYTARELLRMPAAERERVLARMAEAAEEEYRTNPELSEFEAFGEDDLYDEYPAE